MIVSVLVQVIVTISATRGCSTGAPLAACQTIAPNHSYPVALPLSGGTNAVYLDVSALNGTYIPETTYCRKHIKMHIWAPYSSEHKHGDWHTCMCIHVNIRFISSCLYMHLCMA